MGIETTVDPRTKKKMVLANGVVSAVYLNELKTVKTYAGQKGQEWTPTHSVAIVVDGVKVSLGLTDKEKVSAKDADGNWHDVVKGVEVSVEVEEGEPYQGKPQYKAFSKDIIVIDASGAQAPAPAKSNDSVGGAPKTPYKQRDDTPIIAGNARTAAFNQLTAFETEKTAVELIEIYANIGHKIRAEYAANNPTFDAFQVGVSVGQALTTAALMVHVDDTEGFVNEYLNDVVPASLEIVGKLGKPVAEKKTVAKKTATKTVNKKNTAPVDDDDAFDDGVPAEPEHFSDMDSDVPF